MGTGASVDVNAALAAASDEEVKEVLAQLSPEARNKVQEATQHRTGITTVSVVVRGDDSSVVYEGMLPSDSTAETIAEQILDNRNDRHIKMQQKQPLCGSPEEIKWQSDNGKVLEKYKTGYVPSARLLLDGDSMEPSTTLKSLTQGQKSVVLSCTFGWTMKIDSATCDVGDGKVLTTDFMPGSKEDFLSMLKRKGYATEGEEAFTSDEGPKLMEALRAFHPKVASNEGDLVNKFGELAQGSQGIYHISGDGCFVGFIAGHILSLCLDTAYEEE